jgi:hypothetical protein
MNPLPRDWLVSVHDLIQRRPDLADIGMAPVARTGIGT